MLTRHVLSVVTAVSVFVGALMCACPSKAMTPAKAEGRGVPACHAHKQAKTPVKACHEEPKDQGAGCPHCQASLNPKATSDGAVSVPDLGPVALLATLSSEIVEVHVVSPQPASDAAPLPAEWTTLLRLHCALLT